MFVELQRAANGDGMCEEQHDIISHMMIDKQMVKNKLEHCDRGCGYNYMKEFLASVIKKLRVKQWKVSALMY